MYRDGIAKSFDKESRTKIITIKQKSSIPIILRDMAPPKGSIFDPAIKWEQEKEARRQAQIQADAAEEAAKAAEKAAAKKGGGKKDKAKKVSTADAIKSTNAAEKEKKDHERDLQKLSNLRTLRALQDATCETTSGKINRMLKMLHLAVSDLKQGSVNSSEAEVLDILWALEEMSSFAKAEAEIAAEKSAKKSAKEAEKEDKKKSKKDSKKVRRVGSDVHMGWDVFFSFPSKHGVTADIINSLNQYLQPHLHTYTTRPHTGQEGQEEG